mmetsp:Transcript_18912/g.62015  ORF Transcript_18912/g.62015 Transcript_18912/m.62015 type:complete len:223 (-) Transcript_18912:378-1046(-)
MGVRWGSTRLGGVGAPQQLPHVSGQNAATAATPQYFFGSSGRHRPFAQLHPPSALQSCFACPAHMSQVMRRFSQRPLQVWSMSPSQPSSAGAHAQSALSSHLPCFATAAQFVEILSTWKVSSSRQRAAGHVPQATGHATDAATPAVSIRAQSSSKSAPGPMDSQWKLAKSAASQASAPELGASAHSVEGAEWNASPSTNAPESAAELFASSKTSKSSSGTLL